jgi:hypothetical protein
MSAMASADELASELEHACTQLAELAESLTPEQWRATAVNHPEIVVGADEDRPVGVVAHHVAEWFPTILGIVEAMATDEPLPRLSVEEINSINAAHATATPEPDQARTVALIRQRGVDAAQVVRALTQDQLDHGPDAGPGSSTTQEVIGRVLIGHVLWHLESIRATVGR